MTSTRSDGIESSLITHMIMGAIFAVVGGMIIGFVIAHTTGFMGQPYVHVDREVGPFTRGTRCEDESLYFDYRVKFSYREFRQIRLVFNSGDGRVEKTWQTEYEHYGTPSRAQDYDGDGLKEAFIVSLPLRMVYLNDQYDFITRPQDCLPDGLYQIVKDVKGAFYFRKKPDKSKQSEYLYYKWSREIGFYQVPIPAKGECLDTQW
jgi:hypothetical protein